MLSVKRILCPTDFSEPSYRALKAAINLTQVFSARLTLMHVLPATPFEDVHRAGAGDAHFAAAVKNMPTAAKEALERLARERVPEALPSEIVVKQGHAGVEIAKQASAGKIDLIVIAGHGGNDRTISVLGSVATHVVQSAPCHVWVMPRLPGQ